MSMISIEIGEIMVSGQGSLNPKNYLEEKFELYSIPAYDQGVPEFIEGSKIGSIKQIVEPGDVILSKIIPHIRRCWIVGKKTNNRQIASGEWLVFRSDKFYPNYLRHTLLSNEFHAQFMSTVAGVGGSLLRARPKAVSRIQIPLPPLPEQKRIAAILDKADELIQKRKKAIQRLDDLLEATFLDMFGDPITNPKGWQQVQIKNVTEIVKNWNPIKSNPMNCFNYIDIASIDRLSKSIIAYQKFKCDSAPSRAKQLVEKDDILVSTVRPNLNAVARVIKHEQNDTASTGFCVLRPRAMIVLPEYLFQWVRSKHFISEMVSKATGANYPAISDKIVKDSILNLPPIEVQNDFKKTALTTIKLREEFSYNFCLLDKLFNSFQQKAFKGEL